ncbi:MAG: hypothetical protein ACYDDF_01590 [Thermoplasmatota archaeon]
MSEAADHRLPSLLMATLRRAVVAGRIYLALGAGLCVVLAVILVGRKVSVFPVTFPLQLPLFASLGAMGGLMLFSGDRQKGVFEYLIAYGVSPRTLFLNTLISTALLATIVLVVGLVGGLAAFLVAGGTITPDLQNVILLYSLPMTYASSLFSTMCGMVWSALATPRAGINSPAGIAPIFGIAPTILVLYAAEAFQSTDYYNITAAASILFVILVILMAFVAARLMSRERYLSQS